MYKLICLLLLFCLSLTLPGYTQTRYILSGSVVDQSTREPLPGASVYVPALQQGTVTEESGTFQISLPAQDSIAVVFSFVGFASQARTVYLSANQTLDVQLISAVLKDVIVTGNPLQEKLATTQMSMERVSALEVKQLPALFGETDIIKTLQLKPGVQSGGEGTSGLYVRGGGPDQNLVLLDQTLIYNPSHLFGFFSVFNTDAIEGLDLYKGDFPAQYGGRLSSVLDVSSRAGNKDKFSVTGGIGLISSRLTVEGPIQPGKSSFIFSGRRTYFDVFTRQVNNYREPRRPGYRPIPDYYFYDMNGKISFQLSEKDELLISGYYGRDVFGFKRDRFSVDFGWGNGAGAVQWRRRLSSYASSTLSYNYSDYDYSINNELGDLSVTLGSKIQDHTLKYNFDFLPNLRHAIKAGVMYTYHTFGVGNLEAASRDGEFAVNSGSVFYGNQYGAYISDNFTLSPSIQLDGGVRLSGFNFREHNYLNLEPRFAARYLLTENTSFKASYARMSQYVHLVASSGATLPTDVWFPTTDRVRPQLSDQLAAGVSTMLFGKNFLLTNEVYYKWLHNQIDFRDGANLIVNDNLQDEFVFGRGWSYGNEIYLEKRQGRTTGWIGYSLAWTWRQFDDINGGRKFFPRYDRRHDISVVLMHQINKRLSLTGTWVYGSGNAITLPTERFFIQGAPGTGSTTPTLNVAPIFTDRSNYRMAPYHRMDLGVVWRFNPRWGESDLTFSVYNAYNRLNPFFVYFDTVRENSDGTGNITDFVARQVSLFPVIPSVTYNFKF
jgi:hypothetical protein